MRTCAFAISCFIPLDQETPSSSNFLQIPGQDYNCPQFPTRNYKLNYFLWYQLHNGGFEHALGHSNIKIKVQLNQHVGRWETTLQLSDGQRIPSSTSHRETSNFSLLSRNCSNSLSGRKRNKWELQIRKGGSTESSHTWKYALQNKRQ